MKNKKQAIIIGTLAIASITILAAMGVIPPELFAELFRYITTEGFSFGFLWL